MDMSEYRYDGAEDDRRRGDGLLAAALKGAAAGIVGTAAITLGMRYGPLLMQQAGLAQPQPNGGAREEPTEKLAEDVAETAFDRRLDDETRQTAGQAIHWGYGIAWGALYGVAERELGWPSPLAGAAFGAAVGATAMTVVPAMNLSPPPTEQPIAQDALMGVLHLLYGEVTAAVFHTLEA